MIKKRIISALSAAAVCLTMMSLPDKPFSMSDIRADAVTYCSPDAANYALRIAELVNQERKKNGLNELILSEELCQAAIFRTKELTQSFSHIRPDGSMPWTVFSNYGITYYAVAENIAYGQRDADAVMNAWMNSTSGHRENILGTDYKYMGIGVYYSGGVYYWSQFFADGTGMSPVPEVLPPVNIQKSISSCTITLSEDPTYDGSVHKPAVTVKDGTNTLVEGTNYTVSYPADCINAGVKYITITGIGDYKDTVSRAFNIQPKRLNTQMITISSSSFTYDGTPKTLTFTMKDGYKTLVEGIDYTVTYANNVNAGTASCIVTGKGNYTGSLVVAFTIKPKDISNAAVTLGNSSYTYDGTEKTPSVTVKIDGKTLLNGNDYTLSYSNNINPGTASVTVTGKGNYTGSITKTFTIKKNIVSNPVFTAEPGTGCVKLTWSAVQGAEKYAVAGLISGKWQLLAQGADTSYVLKNLKAGTNYMIAVIAKFSGEWNRDFSNAVTVTPKSAVQYPKVSYEVSGKQFKLKWTAVSGADKYGVALYQKGSWKLKAQFASGVTSYTSTISKPGNYKMAVCARVNGKWMTDNINSRAFYVTIQ